MITKLKLFARVGKGGKLTEHLAKHLLTSNSANLTIQAKEVQLNCDSQSVRQLFKTTTTTTNYQLPTTTLTTTTTISETTINARVHKV